MDLAWHPVIYIMLLFTLPLIINLLLPIVFATTPSLMPPSVPSESEFQQRCLSFSPLTFVPNSTLTHLSYVPGNTTIDFPDNDASCGRPSQLVSVDLCRIALSIQTSSRSSVAFEAWLPRVWTGRFLGTGNGGIDGCIHYEDMAYTAFNGFASVGSNNGHNGTSGVAFYENSDVVEDFAWRALHTAVIAGKNLTKKFYGKPHDKSYFFGCSLGGRQGIKSAEKFPDDFDGIVAGAPAVDFNNLASWRASFFPITGSTESHDFISAPTWISLVHSEVLKQCDGLDGVMDGIIEDPDLCHFNPEPLLCTGNGSNASILGNASAKCLASNQVDQLLKIFSPLYSKDGKLLFPAMQPGSETLAVKGLYAGKPFSYSEDWFKYIVYSNPSWEANKFNLTSAALADSVNPFNIRTWPTVRDLDAFRHRGGRILSYHGTQDDKITSFNSQRFYLRLLDGLNSTPEKSNQEELGEFYRYFRISGMFHCNSGPGAWVIGQQGSKLAQSTGFEPERDVLAAVVEWVEKGRNPEWIEGTKFVNDTPEMGVEHRRRHCRYPLRNTYIGGDPNIPENWNCIRYGLYIS